MKKEVLLFCIVASLVSCMREEKESNEKQAITQSELNLKVDMLVEIPAGTNNKFEYNKVNQQIEQDSINGEARIISYLSYPGNYGMIPNTLLSKSEGGDGDPLDIIAIGPAVPKGTLLNCRIVGVLKLLDDGEQDDKLIAIGENSSIYEISSFMELNSSYPGISEIINIWFTNYKGNKKVEVLGFGDEIEAANIYEKAKWNAN